MTERDKVTTQKIRRSGIFNFKDFYQFAYNWFIDEDYGLEEQKYAEEVTGDSKRVEIIWVAKKKISDYFKHEIKLYWNVVGLKNVEVEKDGKRVKMNDGSIEIKITGNLLKDYQSSWEGNPFSKFLRGVYEKFVIEGRIEAYEDKVSSTVTDFIKDMKGFLAI